MKGSYVLVIELATDARLTVGRLGSFEFPAGLYLYCGSALSGLGARVGRHLRQDKRPHWHVDYLTGVGPVVEVWWVADGQRWECQWAKEIAAHGGEVVARGLGSSDCRCPTHLLRWRRGGELAALRQTLSGNAGQVTFGVWTAGEDKDSPIFALGESN